jgi:glycosyltransferase involved in cell wall biosynthesis
MQKISRIVIPTLAYYIDQPSGAARLAFDEAVYLVEHGHEVWLICQTLDIAKPEHEVDRGIHLLRYPRPAFSSADMRWRTVHQQETRRLLTKYLGNVSYIDAIHGHTILQYEGALGGINGKTKSYFTVHSPVRLEALASSRNASPARKLRYYVSGLLLSRLEAHSLRQSNGVMSDSEYTRNTLAQLYGSDLLWRIKVIPGWVDLSRFAILKDRPAVRHQLGWPGDTPVLFSLRRLVPRMGLDRLIEAAKMLHIRGLAFRLYIAGSGPLLGQLQALVSELGLTDTVQFLGRISDELLPSMYGAADAFVLPTSELECFGLIAIESLACGVPVLATPVAAIPELIRPIEPKWLSTDTSSQSICAIMESFLLGQLPQPDPHYLHDYVNKLYSKTKVLKELESTILEGL